ncbi:TPA: VapE domain-containing protein [Pseudomonas aeruginosa]|uniref:VapE domain-containing protein n=1 Tax=Pseudomonas aeruginosa TaxID=287 RepID=UPI0006899BB0|nr:VapE domain-containing protein [Pseudomonas aeruginosa]
MEQLKPDTAAAIDFLRRWSPDDDWCLTAIIPDGKTETRTFKPSEADEAADWIEGHQGKRNLYFTPNRVRRPMSVKPSKPDIAAFRALWADLDPRVGEDLSDERQRIEALLTTGLPAGIPEPSAVVFSGGGYQAFWLLAEPLAIATPTADTPEPWATGEAYNRGLERVFGSDAVHNCDRIMRLPGTINVPTAKKVKGGRKPTLATLVEWNGTAYPLEAFKPAAATASTGGTPPATGKASPRAAVGNGTASPDEWQGKWKIADAAIPPTVGTAELTAWADANGKAIDDWALALVTTGDTSKYDGDRSDMVFAVTCHLARVGAPKELTAGLLLDANNSAFYEHVKEKGGKDKRRYVERQVNRAYAEVAKGDGTAGTLPSGEIVKWDRTNQNGEPLPSFRNTRTALMLMGIKCRYDKFRDRHLIEGHELQELTGDFSDHAERILRVAIAKQFDFDPGAENITHAVLSLCTENRFDSLIDHLNGLPPWDGTPRLDTWLIDYCGAPDDVYVREAGAAWLTAAIVRAFEPGAKFDNMLVLCGTQELGKSALLRVLATGNPDLTASERFSDASFLHARDAREVMEVTAGVWILECAELDGISKKDTNSLKVLIARQSDRGRLAYARNVQDVQRRFVLAGSTNEDSFLQDRTGNRRFWPIDVVRADFVGIARVRDQLMAEALARLRAGTARLLLTPEASKLAKKAQERRVVVDDGYLETLEGLRDGIIYGEGPGWKGTGLAGRYIVKTDDVYKALGFIDKSQRNRSVSGAVVEVMKKLGWCRPEKPVRLPGQGLHRIYIWSGEGWDSEDPEKRKPPALRKDKNEDSATKPPF